MFRRWFHLTLCFAVLTPTYLQATQAAVQAATQAATQAAQETPEIESLLEKSYLEVLEISPALEFTPDQFQAVRKRLEQEEKQKKDTQKDKQKSIEKSIKAAQQELKELNDRASVDTPEITVERQVIHCRIQALQDQLAETKVASQHGIPVEYENLNAKLNLMEKWPAARREIQAQLERGEARSRKWGDVEDIGYRTIEENQADDIKSGQEAAQQMRQMGVLPPTIDDPEITEYVNRVAINIARHSDLQVPLNITVLRSKEINAFALPGGFLYVNHGLILEAENESQLAGVMAHEIAHAVARHGHRLMKKATISSIIFQAAQIGAMIFTGGAVGIGTYYALTYGFQGLGLLISLQLLGVSRDYELEADQLGVQYAWNAGYNPEGFVEFFDIIAAKEGYAQKTSFFRTHPAFYERIVESYREIAFLPRSGSMIEDTKEFGEIQQKLIEMSSAFDAEEKDRPSLYKREANCPDQPQLESNSESTPESKSESQSDPTPRGAL